MHSPKPLMFPIAEEEDETRITILDMHELDCEVREMEEALDKMNRSLSRINRELCDYMGEKVKLEQRLRHIKILIAETSRPHVVQQCVIC